MSQPTITDEAMIDALMVSRTVGEAADRLGVVRETVSRRKAKPDFAVKLAEARADRHRAIGDRIDAAVIRTAQLLGEDPKNFGMTTVQLWALRLRAADLLLRLYLGVRAQATAEQVRELEERLDSQDRELGFLRRMLMGSADGYQVPQAPR